VLRRRRNKQFESLELNRDSALLKQFEFLELNHDSALLKQALVLLSLFIRLVLLSLLIRLTLHSVFLVFLSCAAKP
jgi:hypothetical protein